MKTGPKNTLPVCSRPSTRSPAHGIVSKPIPAEFGVEGFFFRYERHFVYWRHLSNGDIGIVTVLHERMQRIDRFREDFGTGWWRPRLQPAERVRKGYKFTAENVVLHLRAAIQDV